MAAIVNDKSKYFIPAGILAFVVLVWYFLRNTAPAVQTGLAPTPAGAALSSLPQTLQNFSIPPNQWTPAPATSLTNPGGNAAGGTSQSPVYLFYNQAQPQTGSDNGMTERHATGADACGCNDCNTCGTNNMRMPDGGGTSLAYTPQTMVANTDPKVWDALLNNLMTSGLLNPMVGQNYLTSVADTAAGGVPAGQIN